MSWKNSGESCLTNSTIRARRSYAGVVSAPSWTPMSTRARPTNWVSAWVAAIARSCSAGVVTWTTSPASSRNFFSRSARRVRAGQRATVIPATPPRPLCGPKRAWSPTTSTSSGTAFRSHSMGFTFTAQPSMRSEPGARWGTTLSRQAGSSEMGGARRTKGWEAASSRVTQRTPRAAAFFLRSLRSQTTRLRRERRCFATNCPNRPKPMSPRFTAADCIIAHHAREARHAGAIVGVEDDMAPLLRRRNGLRRIGGRRLPAGDREPRRDDLPDRHHPEPPRGDRDRPRGGDDLHAHRARGPCGVGPLGALPPLLRRVRRVGHPLLRLAEDVHRLAGVAPDVGHPLPDPRAVGGAGAGAGDRRDDDARRDGDVAGDEVARGGALVSGRALGDRDRRRARRHSLFHGRFPERLHGPRAGALPLGALRPRVGDGDRGPGDRSAPDLAGAIAGASGPRAPASPPARD